MRKKGGLSLANSLQEEYQKLVKMNYPELVTYLNNKYGPVPGSYFRTPTCKSKILKLLGQWKVWKFIMLERITILIYRI